MKGPVQSQGVAGLKSAQKPELPKLVVGMPTFLSVGRGHNMPGKRENLVALKLSRWIQ